MEKQVIFGVLEISCFLIAVVRAVEEKRRPDRGTGNIKFLLNFLDFS